MIRISGIGFKNRGAGSCQDCKAERVEVFSLAEPGISLIEGAIRLCRFCCVRLASKLRDTPKKAP